MGIPNSKIITDTKSDIVLTEVNSPISISSSPQPIKSIDPRSPSADIARTPIETISSLSIFPECNLASSNKEDLILNDLIDSEIIKTPISIKQNSFKIDKDIRRKLLKDSALKIIEKTDKITALCDQIIESNASETLSDTSLTEMDTPRHVRLLETDIDFIETDIDQVYKKSHTPCLSNATPRDILQAKFRKQIDTGNILELVDPRSPTVGIDRTPVQVIKPLDIDPRSPTVEFERTPIQIPSKYYDNIRSTQIVVDVENFKQKLDTLCITDSEDEKCKNDETFERIKEKSISEKSLEKLVILKRNLIYEDEECGTPTKNTQSIKQNEGNGRTPLSVRNGNNGGHCRSKSANGRLHSEQNTNKNELKSVYAVSKIPVFNKNVRKIRGKVQQCENTPPMKNLNDMKLSKRAQWDSADSTMII